MSKFREGQVVVVDNAGTFQTEYFKGLIGQVGIIVKVTRDSNQQSYYKLVFPFHENGYSDSNMFYDSELKLPDTT